jgi:membrane-bound lytic murein transglycosylase D
VTRNDLRRVLRPTKKNLSGLGIAALLSAAVVANDVIGPDGGLRTLTDAPRRAATTVATGTLAAPAPVTTPPRVTWEMANLDHNRVDEWVARFTTVGKRDLQTTWGRMGKYRDMILAKLEQRNMPEELLYLALIESNFNPKARSPKAASGLWQFISETGRRYGLTVTRRFDERNDPARATDAALDYLADLHERFGSWYLAAAAYNTGEGRVSRILKSVTGSGRGTDADYYRIAPKLPKETREYVPKMIAAARISKEPAKYGLTCSTCG